VESGDPKVALEGNIQEARVKVPSNLERPLREFLIGTAPDSFIALVEFIVDEAWEQITVFPDPTTSGVFKEFANNLQRAVNSLKKL